MLLLVVQFERRQTFKPKDASHFEFPATIRLHRVSSEVAAVHTLDAFLDIGNLLCLFFEIACERFDSQRCLAHHIHSLINRTSVSNFRGLPMVIAAKVWMERVEQVIADPTKLFPSA
jgi:hypothetical protein